jgi:predicted kinase
MRRPGLIMLNGPPAAGKSTLAERYVGDHPLALNLDVDTIRALLGAWMDDPEASGLQARRLALAMAHTHLTDGHDVIVPQLVARTEFVDQLSSLANQVGARFIELFLSIEKAESRSRFVERTSPSAPGRFNAAGVVDGHGGLDALDAQHDALVAFIATRPDAIVIESVTDGVDETYALVLSAVNDP